MIKKIENFLDDEKIEMLLSLRDQLPVRDGTLGGRDDDGVVYEKNSTVYDDISWPGDKGHNKRLLNTIIFGDQDKIDRVADEVTCGEFWNVYCAIGVYDKGDYYDWHLDRLTEGQGRTIKVAYTIFLNDPKEYKGGELVVRHEWGEASVKEKKGTAVFYPSSMLHKVNKIKSGSRLVIIGLLDCMISSSYDRYLLMELNDCRKQLVKYCSKNKDIASVVRRLDFVAMQMNKRFIKS